MDFLPNEHRYPKATSQNTAIFLVFSALSFLEISLWETTRGFESLPLRHINKGRNLALKKEAAKCRPLFYATNTVQRLLFTACHPLPKGWLKKKKPENPSAKIAAKPFLNPEVSFSTDIFFAAYIQKRTSLSYGLPFLQYVCRSGPLP